MYEELVQLLKDKAEKFDYDGWVDTAVVMEKAVDAIEKLIEVIQNHDFLESLIKPCWTSVTERLPEKDNELDAICWISDGSETEGYCITAFYNRDTQKWIPDADWVEPWKITHWMPRPEPPTEEGLVNKNGEASVE